jgi:hypothetical protein
MSVPSAPGYPAGGSSGTSKYTPQIYAKKLLVKFYAKSTYADIANRDFEGNITAFGDKVVIRTIPDVTVFDYYKGMDLRTMRQTPEAAAVELLIDKAKAYSIGIDDIDKIQNDLNALDIWARDGSEQLGISIDRTILNAIYADANAYNIGLTAGAVSSGYNIGTTLYPVAITKDNVLDYIVWCDAVLSEQNIPMNDRFMVIPEWFKALINTSDLRSALFTGDSSNQNLRNGKIGQISNFTMYASNNLTPVTDGSYSAYHVLFGQKSALTFASQLVKNRMLELQDTFGTVMEGLHVFGYKVVKPQALGDLYCYKG